MPRATQNEFKTDSLLYYSLYIIFFAKRLLAEKVIYHNLHQILARGLYQMRTVLERRNIAHVKAALH